MNSSSILPRSAVERSSRFARLLALLALLFTFVTLGARAVQAAPLDAASLDRLQLHVDCLDRCDLGRVATRTTCIASCGIPQSAWNRNLDSVVNRRDYQLALLEFWDAGQLLKICYESGAVVPKGQCGGSNCTATHTAAECRDNDVDGIRAWQETLAGTSDSVAQRLCTAGNQCNGFAEECWYEGVLDLSYCKTRASVSAFHLEKVEENASEVVVNVVFDYAPVPPTVVDVYLQFNGQALVLSESRGLSAATKAGKSVEVRQPGDNVIRVIALGANDSRVIKPGPIAELVFRRKTTQATNILFSTLAAHREDAVAPSQAAHQIGLQQDSAWGSPVELKSSNDAAQGHVLLHYDFESDQRPIAESSALKATDICPLLRLSSGRSSIAGDCLPEPTGNPTDPNYLAAKRKRDQWISQLDALQRGVTVTTSNVEGVTGRGSWFDGQNDHLELPITFNLPATSGGDFLANKQSYSISFWAYQDGLAAAGREQVLYARNAQTSELTQFALLARANTAQSDSFDLVWLHVTQQGAEVRTVVMAGLPNRKWTHFGVSLDAAAGTAGVFVDGTHARTIGLVQGALGTCPQIDVQFPKRMTIHEEGDFALVKGTAPERIYFAVAGGNGLYGIDSMEPNGLGRAPVLHYLDASAKDPDYNPVVNRVVYSSNAAGNSEIWIARGDGGNPQRITDGFGSTADGVFARHPRWAPDGSGIVFESNAYDIESLDNVEGLGYQLYYIEYDAKANEVAIPGPNSTKLRELNYPERVASDDIGMYRLTRATEALSNTRPQWLVGRLGTAELARGELGYTTTDANGANPRARRLRVQHTFWRGNDADKALLPFTADESLVTNKSLLAARGVRTAELVHEQALFSEQISKPVLAPEFSVTNTANGTCTGGGSGFLVSIRYTNSAQPAHCWDTNRNQACDGSTEDRNKDTQCNTLDCNAAEFDSLLIGYDPSLTRPEMPSAVIGTWPNNNGKRLRAVQAFGTTGIVRLELTSPTNNLPIPNGTEVAKIRFCGAAAPALTFKKLDIQQKFSVLTSKTYASTPGSNVFQIPEFTLHDPRIQSVVGAEFSPDLGRLALAVIFDARPMLMRTAGITGTAGSDMLSTEAVRVEGLSWTGVSRFYSCNWVGGVRNPTTKLYPGAFGGALDEVRLVDYVRTAAGYRSESERGHERLVKEGRDGAAPRSGTACTGDAACAGNQLCVSTVCQQVACNPSQPYPCARGRCQRLAVEFSPAEQYACVAECASDATCQESQCANGPCRFCDQTARTCNECRRVVENVGGLSLEYIQGCPDRNSFACDRGTCVSECYAFENGETKYLCDPALEYCRAGRCVLFDWNWADVSPVSLAGLGEMVSHGIKPTAAISQLYRIEVQALGVADHGHPPEVLVEGKATGVFGGNWFDIGRIVVGNETRLEAERIEAERKIENKNGPYTLYTPYPVTNLRLRMIVPPYENLNDAAMGLLNGRAGNFCDLPGAGCRFAAQGSRAMLGYEAWIPGHVEKCRAQPGNCNAEHLKYMLPGHPIALILKVKVKNEDESEVLSSWSNKICPYWNGTAAVAEPVDGSNRPYPLIYGDAAREISNQKTKYYSTAGASALQTFPVATKGFGLLNCNYVDDTGSVAAIAGIEMPVSVIFKQIGADLLDDPPNRETANGCTVNVGTTDAPRYEACFEWEGGSVSMDPFASEPQPYRTLTLERFTSFGWGNGPPLNSDIDP